MFLMLIFSYLLLKNLKFMFLRLVRLGYLTLGYHIIMNYDHVYDKLVCLLVILYQLTFISYYEINFINLYKVIYKYISFHVE